MAITDWPAHERPREKLLSKGADALSDAELLAIFLRVGVRGKSALDLSRELLSHFGDLNKLLSADLTAFCDFPGLGPAKYVQLQASLEISKRYFLERVKESPSIENTSACRQYVLHQLTNRPYETFACIYLDTQHKIISFKELFQGTLDSASVYPREVVRSVIEQQAAKVILCHNHPSGSSVISEADKQITKRLILALDLIDVEVLDHFIVAKNQVISFAEQGLL